MADQQDKPSTSTITIGGITIGVIIGAVTGLFADNMIMGIAIGLAIGIALGIERKSRNGKGRNNIDEDGKP